MTIISINGIKIKINFLIIVLILLLFFTKYKIEMVISLLTIIAHELSHIVVAINKNIDIKEVEIFPFGGIAKLDGFISCNPKLEIIVSLAGPLMNFFLGFILYFFSMIKIDNYIINYALKINLCMGLFNLAPILPLDGGRVVRALLSMVVGYKRSTNILIMISYIISTIMIVFGVVFYFFKNEGIYIVFLFIFIIIAAKKEKQMAAFIFINGILRKKDELIKQGVMKSCVLVAFNSTSAKTILDNFISNKYNIVIVIDYSDKILGVLKQEEILKGIIQNNIYITLGELLNKGDKW